MKLETSFRMVTAAGLALVVCVFGCQTRTPIGEVPDAGNGNDAPFGDGVIVRGTGGTPGTAGAGGGPADAGIQGGGQGGSLALGGGAGPLGGNTGQGATGGVGGSTAMGGVSGTATCQTSMRQLMGEGGHIGDPCYPPMTYSASGFYGDNILAADCTAFTSSVEYELFVSGASYKPVQVTLTLLSLEDVVPAPALHPGWIIADGGDWRVKAYDSDTKQQLFQSRSLADNETAILFNGTGSTRVDIYDCDLVTPARSKIISWAPAAP